MVSILDNIVWNSLSGPHNIYAEGTGAARRYARGFSPIIGFQDRNNPDFDSLASVCSVGETFYTDGWTGIAPDGWQIELETTMFKMVWAGPMPAVNEAPDAVPLGAEHSAEALELALLTNPGPFGLRTIELGDYYGYFEGPQLISMTGERFFAGKYREVSGVCTHPDFQGRGLAKKLMLKVIRQEMLRGEIPFLHVISSNLLARGLYERMGFENYLESIVRMISRTH